MDNLPVKGYSIRHIKTVVDYSEPGSKPANRDNQHQQQAKIEQRLRELQTKRESLVQLSLEVEEQLKRQLDKLQQQLGSGPPSRSPGPALPEKGLPQSNDPPLPISAPTDQEAEISVDHTLADGLKTKGSKNSENIPQTVGLSPEDSENPQNVPQPDELSPEDSENPQNVPQSDEMSPEDSENPKNDPQTTELRPDEYKEPKTVSQHVSLTWQEAETPNNVAPSLSKKQPHMVQQLVHRFNNLEKSAYNEMQNINNQEAVLKESMAALKKSTDSRRSSEK